MKKVALIVCDIDNTLVQKHQPLSLRAKKAINTLKERGVLFGLASGRGIKQLKVLQRQWEISCDVLIGMNGAEMYDGLDKSEHQYYVMKKEWIEECHKRLSGFESDPYIVKNGTVYAKANSSFTNGSQKYLKGEDLPIVVESDEEFWKEDASKTGFRVKEEVMPLIEEHLSKFTFSEYIGFKTESTMYEFGNAKASKGDLLERFCLKHQIPIEEVWAFGDMTNDISLLKSAGVGVCMKNGSDDIKAIADIITEKGVEEDGWADFIENHILK